MTEIYIITLAVISGVIAGRIAEAMNVKGFVGIAAMVAAEIAFYLGRRFQ